MKISVAICTWNRESLLQKTLSNLCDILLHSNLSWELIIVNNNSTDNTEEVIKRYKNSLPIKYAFEPKPGLSNARNKAVEKADGDYIVWIDDDVLVESNWLSSYIEAFSRHPEAVVFGGPISPWFEGNPPKWLLDGWQYIQSSYAIRDLGQKEFSFNSTNTSLFPYGANFAIKTNVQKQYSYNPELGLKAGKIIVGEETVMIQNILDSGNTGWWVPDAKVKHWLPSDRQTLIYLRRYYVGTGQTEAIKDCRKDDIRFLGYPRWLFRQLLTVSGHLIFSALSFKNDWIIHYINFWKIIGKFKGYKA